MIETGVVAPGFDLPGSDGEDIERYQLSEYSHRGPVVLIYYPFDFSPVCTEELCKFRDSEWLSVEPNLDVFGISTDSAYAHREVIQVKELPFPLLSDHDGSTCADYDVLYEELEGHPTISKRAVFVIDSDQIIRYAWEAEDYLTDPDIMEVSEAVQSIETTTLESAASD
jgi:peroxiredoxin